MADNKNKIHNKKQCHPTRGKCVKYKEEVLLEAINAVTSSPKMSVRAAAKFFLVPQATFQSRINGKVNIGTKAGRKSLLPIDLEKKLLDYADNRARMGIGFFKKKILVHAGKLAKKYGYSYKNGKPSNKWWRLLYNRHNKKVTLWQPESTASVCHQCMNLIKVINHFTVLKEVNYNKQGQFYRTFNQNLQ